VINGDGETSRDFCYIANVVQANLLAAMAANLEAVGRVYNIAAGHRTTLNELFLKIRQLVTAVNPGAVGMEPRHEQERAGDVRHSHADISLVRGLLGYAPTHDVDKGLYEASVWYLSPSPFIA
jgi:UDP-N-acetylglucosamine 4-epimerase